MLTESALNSVLRHARQEYPFECCGMVFGPVGRAICDEARPCRNVLRSAEDGREATRAYQFAAEDVRELWESLDGQRPVKVVYHSHSNSSGFFSGYDQRAARLGNRPAYPVDHLVIPVREGVVRAAVQYAWHPRRKSYVEVHRYQLGGPLPHKASSGDG